MTALTETINNGGHQGDNDDDGSGWTLVVVVKNFF